ncbi:MAG: stalk domain-containing protein, partial [Bacilli bacterium]
MNKKQFTNALLVGTLVLTGAGISGVAHAKPVGKVAVSQLENKSWPTFSDKVIQELFDKELASFKKEVENAKGTVSYATVNGNMGLVTYVFKQKEANKPERVLRTVHVDTISKQIVPSGAYIMTEAFDQALFKDLVKKHLKKAKITGVKGIDARTPLALQYDAKKDETTYIFYLNTSKGVQTLAISEVEVAQIPVPIVCDPLMVVPYLFEANGKGVDLARERPYYKDSVLMVPIVTIARDLLGITSETEGKRTTFASHGMTSITVGENSYYIGRMASFKLEHAPEEVNGTVYVPLSFLEKVFGYNYEYVDMS